MNFYTKLISKVDPLTNLPVFKSIQIQLACQACIDAEKAHECVHLQHLIPRWQVTFRAREIKTVYCQSKWNTICVLDLLRESSPSRPTLRWKETEDTNNQHL